ncbi:flavodoxin FldB [Neptuniibacter halophilus]|uniref:flavodoxin FldB n=1 Tax=Neptuniibacter halophilus TaxID=651666 RepID=UPI002573ACAC|nr:flavodoxin FldB [Neptuniibacter halophilus]
MIAPIGLFYGSTTGNTEAVGELIAEKIGFDRVQRIDVAADGVGDIESYDYLILGIPTWDFGELQEDWADLWDQLDQLDLQGKPCALFGLGDQIGYAEWFLDAMGLLHDKLQARGAQLKGYWPVAGYNFEASKALTADHQQFVGLAIDEDCQRSETDERVEKWCQQVMQEFGIN